MKNKRWKRAAKKVQGECLRLNGACMKCKYIEGCDRLEEEYNDNFKFNDSGAFILDIRKAYDAMKVYQGQDYLVNRIFK